MTEDLVHGSECRIYKFERATKKVHKIEDVKIQNFQRNLLWVI